MLHFFRAHWSQKAKKLIAALSCMRKGPKCIQTLWDHPKKFLLCKSTKKSRYARSLGKKPHFQAFPDPKKLIAALGCMRKGPKCIQTLWDHPKKIPFVQKYKEIAICQILREKTPFSGIPRGPKKLIAALSCMRKGPRPQCIQTLWDHPEKNSFCAKVYKEIAICEILREKTPFWSIPRG